MIERPIDTLCYDIIDNKHAILSLEKVTDKYSLCQDFMGTKLGKVRKRIFSDYQ